MYISVYNASVVNKKISKDMNIYIYIYIYIIIIDRVYSLVLNDNNEI
jgi:hypothetical protein